ncbi:DUF262 domain-containing HNH endonuclease family protein [Massilia sp. R2A-15]|uniref:DUF262 domain-containing protein n=1 Tax=Massilia sp. R2A-15 TaxID=3064278 RepID=UPI002734696E|nr:DUF262 domain-containing HNH endonuclease family protein [Massilia sp. R2A-15]WLI90411.1 DUF262 domain-containing HNH endonuclease family protein [Massilia sp. R2A-15]
MQPDKTSAINLFSAPRQYLIPVFQRGYVWTLEKQVAPLWADIEERATAWLERQELLKSSSPSQLAPLRKHFLGSVVLTPITSAFGRVNAYEVIDGQQRTTTLHLLLLAFRHAAEQLGSVQISQMLSGLVRNSGPFAVESDFHKVWPTKAGRDEMGFLNQAAGADAVCAEFPVKAGKQKFDRPLMVQAYLYLHQAIVAFLAGVPLDDLMDAEGDDTLSDAVIHIIRRENAPRLPVADLPPLSAERAQALYMALLEAVQIMTLTLEGDDDPQVIFETLNARGEPLLASDLVRNFVFLDAARRELDVGRLYEKFWKGFDEQRDQNDKVTANKYWREKQTQGRITHPRIDLFFFHYTVLRRKQETKVSHVFQAFKEWWQSSRCDIDTALAQIVTTSRYFSELISPEGGGYLAEFARLVKVLDVSTLTPVYLFLREHYAADDPELEQAVKDLASYLTRRYVCGFTAKGYNRIFLRMLEVISQPGTNRPAQALRTYLTGLQGHSGSWPTDAEFRDSWMRRPVYKELRPAKTAAILRALEVAGRTSRTESILVPTVDKLTVEHILPQGWAGTAHYPLLIDSDDELARRNHVLQCFGNLTLLTQELNSSVSNGPFLDVPATADAKFVEGKRSQIGKHSLLNLNWYLQSKEKWTEAEITERAEILFGQALNLWPLPS